MQEMAIQQELEWIRQADEERRLIQQEEQRQFQQEIQSLHQFLTKKLEDEERLQEEAIRIEQEIEEERQKLREQQLKKQQELELLEQQREEEEAVRLQLERWELEHKKKLFEEELIRKF